MTLSGFERETIINFNEADAMAQIFTYNKAWQRHLEQVLGIKPDSTNGFGGRDYTIPKKWLRLPRGPRKLSAEVKKSLAARLAKGRRQKILAAPKTYSVLRDFRDTKDHEGKNIAKVEARDHLPLFS